MQAADPRAPAAEEANELRRRKDALGLRLDKRTIRENEPQQAAVVITELLLFLDHQEYRASISTDRRKLANLAGGWSKSELSIIPGEHDRVTVRTAKSNFESAAFCRIEVRGRVPGSHIRETGRARKKPPSSHCYECPNHTESETEDQAEPESFHKKRGRKV